MKKALFIYNPKAGDYGIQRRIDHIIKKFQKNNVLIQPYRFLFDNINTLEMVLVENKYDYIVVSGGDGTLNKVLNLMMKHEINIPVGSLPAGTSNDFARNIELPPSLDECIEIIINGKTNKFDVGLINKEKYFLTTCAGGLFVGVSFNTQPDMKRNLGTFAYFLQAMTEMPNIRPFNATIKTDNDTFNEDILLYIVVNGKHAAGFNNIFKEADMTDGIMDIAIVKKCSQIDLTALFFKVLNTGIVDDKNLIKIQTKNFSIDYKEKISVSIDGEEGTGMPINIKFKKQALTFFVK